MSKGTVLIVDDEQAIRESLSLILEDEGFTCLCAADGLDALKVIKEKKIDILITDVHMPKMDGLQLLKETRLISPETHSIVITAYSETDNAIRSLHMGASGYLIKPLDFDDVIKRINELLCY